MFESGRLPTASNERAEELAVDRFPLMAAPVEHFPVTECLRPKQGVVLVMEFEGAGGAASLASSGRGTLRTPEGERELVEGDVACFVRGAAGAHQVRNATEELVRILMLSTRIAPEILVYPDSDKVLTKDAKDDDIFTTRYGEPVDYWEGES
jgi:hypothetical protein